VTALSTTAFVSLGGAMWVAHAGAAVTASSTSTPAPSSDVPAATTAELFDDTSGSWSATPAPFAQSGASQTRSHGS